MVRTRKPTALCYNPWLVAAGALGLRLLGLTASPLKGPAGNVEFLGYWRRGEPVGGETQRER